MGGRREGTSEETEQNNETTGQRDNGTALNVLKCPTAQPHPPRCKEREVQTGTGGPATMHGPGSGWTVLCTKPRF